jgi:tripartite ATP-independent transporter DctM subunit
MRIRPALGPPGPVATRRQRIDTLSNAGPMILIVAATIGGIYLGVFTPSEAAAVGATLSLGYALWKKSLGGGTLQTVLLETVKTTSFVFLILIGALVFGPFLALSGLPLKLAGWLIDLEVPRIVILSILVVFYIVLGMFLEGFSILVLTLPIVIPIVKALEYDLIWFGVIMVIVLEMGLISPPVGINVFVVKGLVPDVPLRTVFAGIFPFWIAMLVCLIILIAFPQIALFLPDTMIR